MKLSLEGNAYDVGTVYAFLPMNYQPYYPPSIIVRPQYDRAMWGQYRYVRI